MATDSVRETRSGIPDALFEGNKLDQPTFHRLYEQTPEKFRAELIGGVVRLPLSWGPVSHGELRALATTWLAKYADATPGADALLGTTILLGEDSEPQPDICFRYREGTSHESNDYCVGPPELMIEVSQFTMVRDLVEKRADYQRHGVREYLVLVVDEARAIWFVRGEDGRFVELSPSDGVLKSRVFPGLWLDPEALFRGDYKQVMAVLNEGLASVGRRGIGGDGGSGDS